MSTMKELDEGMVASRAITLGSTVDGTYWRRVKTISTRFHEVFVRRFNEALAENKLTKAKNLLDGAYYEIPKKERP